MNGWISRFLRVLATAGWIFGLRRLLIELSGLLDIVLGVVAVASPFVPALRAQLGPLEGWEDWQLLALGAVLILVGGVLVVPSLLARVAFPVEPHEAFFIPKRRSRLLDVVQMREAPTRQDEARMREERARMREAPTQPSRASRTAAEASPQEEASPDEAAPEEALFGRAEAEAPAETDRFIDLTIYRGHLYQGDEPAPADRIDDLEPLPAEEGCTLEVAIRRERTGIAAGVEVPRVRNPRKNQETLTIYARVRSLDPEVLEFEDGLLDFEWPYDADSGTALFRFTPHKPAGRDDARASIEVRLYSAELELLELVEIRDITVGEAPTGALRTLAWPEARPSDPTTGPRRWPHAFTIHVFAVPGGYTFEVLRRAGDRPLPPVALGRTIPSGELEELLRRVRDFWTGLVVGILATRPQLTETSYGKILNKMAELGHDGWRLLFGNRRGAMAGSSEALGELLTGLGGLGSIVQVSYAAGAEGFVFPWSVLRPPLARDETPDPEAFWGLRYQIEQLRAGPRSNRLDDEPVAVATVIDPGFGQSGEHAEHLRALGAGHAEHVALLAPIGDREGLFEALEQPRAAHLYYFFCHGYAPGRRPAMARDALVALRERIEALAPGSPERAAWETWLGRTAEVGDEAKLFFGTAELTESQLSRGEFFAGRRPIVFLNMCQSADLLPAMSSGLARLFLDRNAAAVVGTECPMTAVFAACFGEAVLGRLLEGAEIGEAVWQARRQFHEARNPLGFAYTLYGRGDAGFALPRAEAPAGPGTAGQA